MDRSQDFKSLQEKVQTALVAATRTTNQLAAEDLSFQKTSNPAVEDRLDETSGHLLELASSLIKSAAKGTDLKASQLEDADDIDVHWSRIVDVVDTLLEKADTCLDEYTGLIKRKGAPTEETVRLYRTSCHMDNARACLCVPFYRQFRSSYSSRVHYRRNPSLISNITFDGRTFSSHRRGLRSNLTTSIHPPGSRYSPKSRTPSSHLRRV